MPKQNQELLSEAILNLTTLKKRMEQVAASKENLELKTKLQAYKSIIAKLSKEYSDEVNN